jgi:orotate phosphoribosyltransferase
MQEAVGSLHKGVTIVDRLEGAAATFQQAGIPFTAILTAADFR